MAGGPRPKAVFLWVHYSDPHDPYAPPGMPDDLALSLNGRKAGSFRIGDYAWNTVTLDLRAGENILAFETMNPYQPDPSKFRPGSTRSNLARTRR